MKQSELYERYLRRLRDRRESSNYYSQARSNLRSLSQPYAEAQETYEDRMRRKDLPEGVAQEYSLKHAQRWAETVGKQYSAASRAENERRTRYNEQIDEVAFKKDIAEQQEEELERKKEEAKTKGLLGLGGSVLGAVAGSVIPGAGTAVGAAIGGGLGSIAGGVAGGEELDVGMLSQGISQMAGGIGTAIFESKQRALANTISEFAKTGMGDMSSQELGALKMGLESLINSGQYGKAEEYLNNFLDTSGGASLSLDYDPRQRQLGYTDDNQPAPDWTG